MKKTILLFSLFSFLFSLEGAFAYTSSDVDNADFLAGNTIITSQKDADRYHLDDKILRQEVIGVALKMRGITIPNTYNCKKYFADATGTNWVCGAVELAADNGLITRENKKVRPGDFVTHAEALAILLKAGKVSLTTPRRITQADGTIWSLYQDLKKLGFTQWQADMLDSLPGCAIINHGNSCEDGADTNRTFARFQPNALALRSEVFEFSALMLDFKAVGDLGSLLDDLDILVNTIAPKLTTNTIKILSLDSIKALLIGEPIQKNVKFPKAVLVVFSDFECSFCARFYGDVLEPLVADTSLGVALVHKNFPLSSHEYAYDWALESECVAKNLGDADYFDYIGKRYDFQDESIATISPQLSQSQLDVCLKDTGLAQNIADDQKLGIEMYQVAGTPTTLIINPRTGYYQTLFGAQSKQEVEAIIQTVVNHQ